MKLVKIAKDTFVNPEAVIAVYKSSTSDLVTVYLKGNSFFSDYSFTETIKLLQDKSFDN